MVQKYEKRLKREKFTCYFFQKTDSKTFMPFLAPNFRKNSIFARHSNYSAPPMGMSNRLTVVLQQELH